MTEPLFTTSLEQVFLKDTIKTIKMSPDGSMIAIAYRSKVMIVSPDFKEVLYRFQIKNQETDRLEVAQDMTWQPCTSTHHTDWKLVCACLDGGIAEWMPSYGEKCERHYFSRESQYSTACYNTPGDTYVLGGSKPKLEVIDNLSNKVVQTYDGLHNFHNKGIQTVRFFQQSQNLFCTGNLDSSVKFWDLRQPNQATHKIYGVQVTGHAVDMHVNGCYCLIGGSETEEGIQLWDLRNTGTPVRAVPYGVDETGVPYSVPVNTVKFVPGTQLAIVGVQDEPVCPVKLFNMSTGEQVFDFPGTLKQSGQSLDVNAFTQQVIVGDHNAVVKVLNYDLARVNQMLPSAGSGIFQAKNQKSSLISQPDATSNRSPSSPLDPTRPGSPKIIFAPEEFQEDVDFSKRHKVAKQQITSLLQCREAKQTFVWGSPPPTTRSRVTTPPVESEQQPQLEEPQFDDQNDEFADEYQQEVYDEQSESDDGSLRSTDQQAGFSKETGAYTVAHDNAQEIISTMREENKRQMQEQVKQTEEEIMREFMRKAELVQLVSFAESQDSKATTGDTKAFIKQIESHLLTSQFSKKHKPAIADIEHITQELYEKEKKLSKLPQITSRVKNIKKMLQDDLISDGALVQNVPHSSSSRVNLNSRGSLSKKSFAPSQVSNAKPKQHQVQDSYVMQYQKNMIVEYPDDKDSVARNFDNFWSRPQKRKYSVPESTIRRQNKVESQKMQTQMRRPSYLPELDQIPELAKKRLPDSDHLAQMRKYLVAAHRNENFIHELGDDGFVPTAIKERFAQEQLSPVEQRSFFDMLKSHTESKNKNIKTLINDGIPEDHGAEVEDSSDIGDFVPPPHEFQQIPQRQKEQPVILTPLQIAFEKAIQDGDMQTAYDLAQKAGVDLIAGSLQASAQEMKTESQKLKGNTYFRKYASKYTRQLNEVLDKNFGPRLNDRFKVKDPQDSFNNRILSIASEKNVYRKKMPEVFQQKFDGSSEIQDVLKRNFKQVSETNKFIKAAAAGDPMTDQDYLRRLKQANYGKWYLSPKDFPNKVEILNSFN